MWLSDPLVPVTRSVKLPIEALTPALIVKVEVAVAPEGGVIGVGSEKATSVGAAPTQEGDKVTDELKPLSEVTLIVATLLEP